MAISKEAAVGVFITVSLICLGYMTVKFGKMEIFNSSDRSVFAIFSSVSGLKVGAEVNISGVKVGRVKSIRLDGRLNYAIVELKIDKSIILTKDTIASVKTNGLIGDKYIRLAPGGAAPLAPGDEIIDTESALDVEELISKYIFGKV